MKYQLSKLFLLLLPTLHIACTKDTSTAALPRSLCSMINAEGSSPAPRVLNGSFCSSPNTSPVVDIVAIGGSSLATGVLIGSRTVLTGGVMGSAVAERPGQTAAIVDGQSIRIISAATHPGVARVDEGYENLIIRGYKNEVAILTLEAPARTAPMPIIVSRDTGDGDRAALFGFGATAFGATRPARRLNGSAIRIGTVRDFNLLSRIDEGDSGACTGDYGAPVVVESDGEYGIVGLAYGANTAQNEGFCVPGAIQAFTNLQNPETLNWIQDVVADLRTR